VEGYVLVLPGKFAIAVKADALPPHCLSSCNCSYYSAAVVHGTNNSVLFDSVLSVSVILHEKRNPAKIVLVFNKNKDRLDRHSQERHTNIGIHLESSPGQIKQVAHLFHMDEG